jgi:hypothetical protein
VWELRPGSIAGNQAGSCLSLPDHPGKSSERLDSGHSCVEHETAKRIPRHTKASGVARSQPSYIVDRTGQASLRGGGQ